MDYFWLKEYLGAKWIRVDFHLHTPGSSTFKCPSGLDPKNPANREIIIKKYVEELAKSQIEVAAITDYNGIRSEWFEPIRNEAHKHNIIIYPGAELSFRAGKRGLHIIAVFPLEANIKSINRAIHALDKNPALDLIKSDGSIRVIDVEKNIEDALIKLRNQFDNIYIIAHPNDSKGLFTTFNMEAAAKFIREVNPDAMEGLDQKDIDRLRATGEINVEKVNLASVQFSDPKHIEEIGSKTNPNGLKRATFLKLSETKNLLAIRLAFHDPCIRICTDKTPAYNHTRFLGLVIEGSGFLAGLRLSFSPELNTLIGGRGVGKSAILEVIRYALALEYYEKTDYRKELIKYALGNGGKITLYLDLVINSGLDRIYRIDRTYGIDPKVFELNQLDGTIKEVELKPTEIFPNKEAPLFFGQREVYEVTQNESHRLRLLDDIIGREAKKSLQDLDKLNEKLKQNINDVLVLENSLEDKEEIEHKLKGIDHEIQLFQREGLTEKLKESTLISQDDERLNKTIEIFDAANGHLRQFFAELQSTLLGGVKQAKLAQSANKDILENVAKEIKSIRIDLKVIEIQGGDLFDQTRDKLSKLDVDWKERKGIFDNEMQRIKQELGQQKLDPDQLDKLTREQVRLTTRQDELSGLEKKHEDLLMNRKILLDSLQAMRLHIFDLRKSQADDISLKLDGRIRIHIEFMGQKKLFVEQLTSFMHGSGIDHTTIEKLCNIEGQITHGRIIAESARKGEVALQEVFNLTTKRASQVFKWLNLDRNRLLELESLSPDDHVQVFLKLNEMDIPLDKLSGGQRATAMLLLLLTQEERLLIVDQPEDDLDNRFIYEDIVKILRNQKEKRQVIVATHNPNIPVLGDAELIVSLDSTINAAKVSVQGSVDRLEVCEAVKHIMEGGEQAFRRRAEKYGWTVDENST